MSPEGTERPGLPALTILGAVLTAILGCGGTLGEPDIDGTPDVWRNTVLDPHDYQAGDTDCLYGCGDAAMAQSAGDSSEPAEDAPCGSPSPGVLITDCFEICNSGKDEDGDGLIDCDDSDCWTVEANCPESCGSGHDEDADGLVDCRDDDCWVPGGMCSENCDSADDEDGDGVVGCDDPDCAAILRCDPDPVYEGQVQPVLAAKCGPCHTTGGLGGTCFARIYDDMLAAAQSCPGKTVAQCLLTRIFSGTMPKDEGCSGDPVADAGRPGCMTQVEVDAIDRWVQSGAPQR